MDAKNWKYVLWTIAYAIGLVLVVLRIEDILRAAGLLLGLLRPLVFGIVIAFVLDHPFERLRGWFLRKLRLPARRATVCAIVAVYLLAFGLLAALVGIVAPEVVRNLLRFAGSADLYLHDLQDALNRLTAALGLSRIDLSEVMALVDRYMGSLTSALSDFLPQIVEVTASVVSALATAFVSLALSVYIMSGKEKLLAQLRRCLRVYLPADWQGPLGRVAAIVYEVFDNYVAGQCKEAVILGSLCFAGMTVLRLDYAGMVSVVVGVTALVPILGAYIGGRWGCCCFCSSRRPRRCCSWSFWWCCSRSRATSSTPAWWAGRSACPACGCCWPSRWAAGCGASGGCCWACPWPPSFTSFCGRTSAAGRPGCPRANRRKKEGGAARCPLCAVQLSAARPAFSCSSWLDWMWISPSVLCSRATNCSGGSFAPSPSQ